MTRYTIRVQDLETYDIDTVGDFHSLVNLQHAKEVLNDHLKTLAEAACDSSM